MIVIRKYDAHQSNNQVRLTALMPIIIKSHVNTDVYFRSGFIVTTQFLVAPSHIVM